jgi:eukaryotic-like serine/threonine-protein kinase
VHARPTSGSSYERLLLIGRGGMGEVFLARQRGVQGFERPVALKRLLPCYQSDPELQRMFLAEAHVTAGLNHPNICQTIDLCAADPDLFLVLELLEGVTLATLMKRVGPLPTDVVGGLLLQACSGLEHAHSKGLIHRDLSPSNLFITSGGVLKILDFGVAKVLGSERSSSGLKGKSPYMSPEEVAGVPLDQRSDLFALGAVGLEALSGAPLFLRDSDYLTYEAILEGTRPVALSTSPLDPVLAPCLDVEPATRPQSARDLSRTVHDALRKHGGEASPHDLAGYVERHMAEEIASFRARIAEALARSAGAAPFVLHTVEMVAVPPAPASADSTTAPLSPGHAPAPPRDGSTGAVGRTSPGRRARRALVGAGVAAAIALSCVLWLRGQISNQSRGDAPEIGSPAAVAARAAPPPRAAAMPADPAPPPRAATAQPGNDAADAGPPVERAARPASRRTRKPGYVSLDASPFATLHIDGKAVGTTPLLRHALAEGVHAVDATTQDGRRKRLRIRVRAGKLTVQRIRFD